MSPSVAVSPSSVLDCFHPAVRGWFTEAFDGPTAAQIGAWPAIARGDNTLLLAPTGSGKTLAAFLVAIDRIMFDRCDDGDGGSAGDAGVRKEERREDTLKRELQQIPGVPGEDTPRRGLQQDTLKRELQRDTLKREVQRDTVKRGSLQDKPRANGVRVLYISPLKTLGVDVERNLRSPIAGVRAVAERDGVAYHEPVVGVRSGDTPSAERYRLTRQPPDILITTPESLYLIR